MNLAKYAEVVPEPVEVPPFRLFLEPLPLDEDNFFVPPANPQSGEFNDAGEDEEEWFLENDQGGFEDDWFD